MKVGQLPFIQGVLNSCSLAMEGSKTFFNNKPSVQHPHISDFFDESRVSEALYKANSMSDKLGQNSQSLDTLIARTEVLQGSLNGSQKLLSEAKQAITSAETAGIQGKELAKSIHEAVQTHFESEPPTIAELIGASLHICGEVLDHIKWTVHYAGTIALVGLTGFVAYKVFKHCYTTKVYKQAFQEHLKGLNLPSHIDILPQQEKIDPLPKSLNTKTNELITAKFRIKGPLKLISDEEFKLNDSQLSSPKAKKPKNSLNSLFSTSKKNF